jgi:cysteinyl-tRNA synthetase
LSEQGYEPLVWRYYCLGANYRTRLNFSWEGLDSAAMALNRLRMTVYEWGLTGTPDEDYIERFTEQVNDDLNMPRALALMWELAKSELPSSTKKATIQEFDKVLGLCLPDWQPAIEIVPSEITALIEQRQQARLEKRWQAADMLRERIRTAGYEIEDTPHGSRVRAFKHQGAD